MPVAGAGEGTEGGAKGVAMGAAHAHEWGVGDGAVVAADEGSVQVEESGAGVPVAGVENDVVEFGEVGWPQRVGLIEEEVP